MQCREIGKSNFTDCDKERFDYCNKSPEHDTRILSKEANPVKRLHNLCDMLQEQQDKSPYSADAWSELEEENEMLKKELAFYGFEAKSISQNFDIHDESVIASVTVLKLDAGKRAFNLLNKI